MGIEGGGTSGGFSGGPNNDPNNGYSLYRYVKEAQEAGKKQQESEKETGKRIIDINQSAGVSFHKLYANAAADSQDFLDRTLESCKGDDSGK